jgi:hypothetical protein
MLYVQWKKLRKLKRDLDLSTDETHRPSKSPRVARENREGKKSLARFSNLESLKSTFEFLS